jgi:phage/plasmid-associated DNA primase
VVAANDDWRSENDQLGRFIEECCVVSESLAGKARPLYECYRQWAEGAGENAITETLFGRRLKTRGSRRSTGATERSKAGLPSASMTAFRSKEGRDGFPL